jgi:two-component system KDP operon response regulator KdpE
VARILVVDDEKQITRILSTALRSIGYEVVLASNGREGYERI